MRHHATRQLEGLVEVGADKRLLLGGADGGDHLAVDGVLVGLALLSQLVLLRREGGGGGVREGAWHGAPGRSENTGQGLTIEQIHKHH